MVCFLTVHRHLSSRLVIDNATMDLERGLMQLKKGRCAATEGPAIQLLYFALLEHARFKTQPSGQELLLRIPSIPTSNKIA